MDTVSRQLVTIVAEAVVENRLISDIKACGAKGYSLGHVTGEGTTGSGALNLTGPSVRLETVVTQEVADRILEMLTERYFETFAVVMWASTVQVARPQRF
jgi:nitrogen regulatory protein P-II 2